MRLSSTRKPPIAKALLLFDMDGTLIISKNKPKNKGLKTPHLSYMSIKSQMKDIVVKNGVPAKKVMELDRMSLIWNETILQLEQQNVPEQKIQKIIQKINVPFMRALLRGNYHIFLEKSYILI
jgi:hypothetical protein